MKKLNIFLIVLLVLVIAAVVTLFVMDRKYKDNLEVNITDEYTIEITKGMYVSDVITMLHQDGVIESEFMTKMFIRMNPEYEEVIVGKYVFSSGITLEEMFELFSIGVAPDHVVFQILEGYGIEDYADVLAQSLGDESLSTEILAYWDSPEFVQAVISDYNIVDESVLNPEIYHPLEGYIKPDTYHFSTEDFQIEYLDFITRTLIAGREKDFDDILTGGAVYNEYVTNPHQMLTLASIVEREATTYEDRQMVAGIFMNRLINGDQLGSDITTYYAVGVPIYERDLTNDELNSVNGYNTRGSLLGLPVGAVNNPSRESINATFNYVESDFYFFVSDKNGKMYYTSTFEEHTAIIEELKANDLWYTWD